MHELSLCQRIADVVRPHAGGRRVDVVRVQVGALRQVVPSSLEYCWSLVRVHEQMPEARLELDWVPAEVECRTCSRRGTIESRWTACCPNCGSTAVDLLRGDEFLVTSVDVSDSVGVEEAD